MIKITQASTMRDSDLGRRSYGVDGGLALFVVTITRAAAPGLTRHAVSVMANIPCTEVTSAPSRTSMSKFVDENVLRPIRRSITVRLGSTLGRKFFTVCACGLTACAWPRSAGEMRGPALGCPRPGRGNRARGPRGVRARGRFSSRRGSVSSRQTSPTRPVPARSGW